MPAKTKKPDPFENLSEEEAASVEAIEEIALDLAEALVLIVRTGMAETPGARKTTAAAMETAVVKVTDNILKFAMDSD